MKKQSLTILLIAVSTASYGQIGQIFQPFDREDGKGVLILTPLLAHNLSERVISSEASLSVGLEAISNQSSISLGYVYRRYFDIDKVHSPSFHAVRLSSAVYPFADFGLGFSAQGDLRRGEYLNDKVTIGADILDDCGKVIGKEDDTRGTSVRNKVFGTIGLIYKIDKNFRVESGFMIKDYTPNRWHDPVSTNPFARSPLKVTMSYTIPIIQL